MSDPARINLRDPRYWLLPVVMVAGIVVVTLLGRSEQFQFLRYPEAEIAGVTLYGPENSKSRGGILSFNIDGIHPHDIAQIAGDQGVAIRAGHHCCQPLMQHLGVSSTARASFSFYNNKEDITALVMAIHQAQKILGN